MSSNPKNYILYQPIHGDYKGKNYLFVESNKRWFTIRNYIKGRPKHFERSRFLLIIGFDKVANRWKYGKYSQTIHTDKIPLPQIIYDIRDNKVYLFKGQLWEVK